VTAPATDGQATTVALNEDVDVPKRDERLRCERR
jgi:hypothetical protein